MNNHKMAAAELAYSYGKKERMQYLVDTFARIKRDIKDVQKEEIFSRSAERIAILHAECTVRNCFYRIAELTDSVGRLNHQALVSTGSVFLKKAYKVGNLKPSEGNNFRQLEDSELFTMLEDFQQICMEVGIVANVANM